MLTVRFHGVRGAAPAPGGHSRYGARTACVALEVDGEDPVLLDLGSGLTGLGPGPFRASVLLSHLHWGHVQGLPVWDAVDHAATRLDVYGPCPHEGPLARLMAAAMGPPWFRRRLDQRAGTVRFHEVFDEDFAVGPAKVMARSVPHGDEPTNGYRVEWDGVSVAYVSDHQPPEDLATVAEPVLELAAGVDLLIHDAQHSAADWPGRGGDGHCPSGYAVQVAREAGARRLVLFHHDPGRDDDELDRMLEVARRTAERLGVDDVVAAAEGLVVTLPGPR